jgi:hypothetical protein
MKKFTLMIIVLVAAATLTMSGCGGGGSSSGTPPTPPPAVDTDGDGVLDAQDAFPNEPAASLDDDGDGFPDQWHPNVTDADIADSGLSLDAFPGCSYAAVASATDPEKVAKDHPSTVLDQLATCGLVASNENDDDDGDGLLNKDDPAPQMGVADIPTEREVYGQLKGLASPFFDAKPFEQQMIRFEEFGPEAMPTSAVEKANWIQLPQPQDYENGPVPTALDVFLKQEGVWPMPQRLSNVDIDSPWKSAVREYLGRDFIQPPVGVAAPAEGRPSTCLMDGYIKQ